MASTLVDSPPSDPSELTSADVPAGSSAGPPAGPDLPSAPADQTCSKCGAPMALGQDWCLQCGAGAPGSMGTPGWRSAATILGVTVALALGAAAAAYAALTDHKSTPPTVTATVAQTTPPALGTPSAPTTPINPVLPLGAVKPPKIPLTPSVPKIPTTTTPTPSLETPTGTSSTPTATTPSGGGGTSAEPQPAAILLDTNAASTYNPYNYPAAYFGDPSLAIDGDTSTAWTAQVDPATAPKMAEGVLVNLNGRQKIKEIKLTTSTPGMTVQVFGAQAATAPASIIDHAWLALSRYQVVTKKHVVIKLKDAGKAFSFLTLWISNAPASSVGTATAPGHVSVNELELFPAS